MSENPGMPWSSGGIAEADLRPVAGAAERDAVVDVDLVRGHAERLNGEAGDLRPHRRAGEPRRIVNYAVAHDSGTIINPLIVDGQVQGGVAHGIGNALLEWMKYDDNAQPLTTTFADYLLPMATDVPTCRITHIESPTPLNPLGVKGAGEGGTIPAAAAIPPSRMR